MLVEFSNLKLTNEAKIIESLISWVWFSLIVSFFGYGKSWDFSSCSAARSDDIGTFGKLKLAKILDRLVFFAQLKLSLQPRYHHHIMPHIFLLFYIYLWVVSLFSQIPLKLILVTHIHIAFPVGSCKIYLKYIATRQVPAEGRRMKAIYFLLFNNNKLIVYQMRPRRRTVCSDRNHIFPLPHPIRSACAWEKKREKRQGHHIVYGCVRKGLRNWDNLCVQNGISFLRCCRSDAVFKSIGFKLEDFNFVLTDAHVHPHPPPQSLRLLFEYRILKCVIVSLSYISLWCLSLI